MADNEPRIYSKAEAAQRLGLSVRSLDRLRTEGRIGYRQTRPHGKVMFTQRHLEDFLALTTTQLVLFPTEPTKPTPTPPARKPGRPRKVPTGPRDGVQLRLSPESDDSPLMDEVATRAELGTSLGAELPAPPARPPIVPLAERKRPSRLLGTP